MRLRSHVVFLVLAASALCQDRHPSREDQRFRHEELRANEVSVATQVWKYSRIYPLLDGLFQDVAATQVSALTLTPNASNGVSLDALQQSFQAQI
jgi:hypothetical protein